MKIIYATLDGLVHENGSPARIITNLVTENNRVIEKMYDESSEECRIEPAPADFHQQAANGRQ